jgi:hypothetical protein
MGRHSIMKNLEQEWEVKMMKWTDVMVAKLRYQEIVKEAEEMRLLQKAMRSQNSHRQLHHHILTWLGKRMVAWGLSLQEHHASGGTGFGNQTIDVV